MTTAPVLFYSNRMGSIFLLASEEILGKEECDPLLRHADLPEYDPPEHAGGLAHDFSFEQISRIQEELLVRYGPAAGRGLALRIGRACLKHTLRGFGHELGLLEKDFRFLPLPARLGRAAQAMAGLFNRYTDQRVTVQIDRARICWQIERCPVCWGRRSDEPCCDLEVGLLQETMSWASGGKYYPVVEEQCIACGDRSCVITSARTPVG